MQQFAPIPLGLVSAIAAVAVAYVLGTVAAARGTIKLPDQNNRIGCIDGLRGYLAISVAVHHFLIWLRHLSGQPWEAPPSNIFNNFGQAAVVLFFMITGALFYARMLPSLNSKPVNWPALYVSRIFRLLPVYWFAILLVAAIAIARRHGAVGNPGQFAGALLQWAAFTGQPDIAG